MKKNFLLLIGFLCLVGAIFYGYTNKKKSASSKENQNKIFSFSESNVFKWTIFYQKNKISLKKNEHNIWEIIYPKKYKTDQSQAIANVKNFNTMVYQAIVDTKINASKWGINKNSPYYTIELKNNKGKNIAHTFYQGNSIKVPKGFYITYSHSPHVYAVEDWVILALQKPLKALREKDFLQIEPEDIQTIIIKDLILIQTNKKWQAQIKNKQQTPKLKIANYKHADALAQTIGFIDPIYVIDDQQLIEKIKKTNPIFLKITSKSKKKSIKKTDLFIYKYQEKFYASTLNNPLFYQIFKEEAQILIQNKIDHYLLN